MAIHPVAVPGCAPFRLHTHEGTDTYISREIERNAIWEPLESSVVLELLAPGDVFVDLGANIGYYTVLASLACGPGGRVYAFEPEPRNFQLLERNVAENGLDNVTLVNAAAAATNGYSDLFLSEDNQGDHRLYDNEARARRVRVEKIALDRWFAGRDVRIDLVKMDTQGFEAQILAGMTGLLAANRNRLRLIIEFWPFGLLGAGDDAGKLIDFLEARAYGVSKVDDRLAGVVPASWPQLRAEASSLYHPDTRDFTNLLLSPPASPDADRPPAPR